MDGTHAGMHACVSGRERAFQVEALPPGSGLLFQRAIAHFFGSLDAKMI